MTDSAVRNEIKNMLLTIPGIGKVHDYERFTVDTAKFLALFKDAVSEKIFGWEITRESVKLERIAQKYKAISNYVIKGYYALADDAGTEKTFNAVVDIIIQKFIDTQIPGTQGQSLPQVSVLQARMFGSILCHYAEIRISIAYVLDKTAEELGDLLKVGLHYYLTPGDDKEDSSDLVTLEGP